jgi:hypothetical protein
MINHPDEHDRARRDHEADTLPQINFPGTSSLVGRCLTRAGCEQEVEVSLPARGASRMEPPDAWRQPFGDSVWPISLSIPVTCAAATPDGGGLEPG